MTNRCNAWRMWIRISLALAGIFDNAAPSLAQSDANAAQNPIANQASLPVQNDTNFRVGPLRETQKILLVEPVIPIKITPEWNLITRWITPVVSEPRVAPEVGPEFGLGNMLPQFYFSPAHPGAIIWGFGPQFWIPSATNKTLGVDKWGGGPAFVALTIQGPWMVGVLTNNAWAGTTGSSATGVQIQLLQRKS